MSFHRLNDINPDANVNSSKTSSIKINFFNQIIKKYFPYYFKPKLTIITPDDAGAILAHQMEKQHNNFPIFLDPKNPFDLKFFSFIQNSDLDTYIKIFDEDIKLEEKHIHFLISKNQNDKFLSTVFKKYSDYYISFIESSCFSLAQSISDVLVKTNQFKPFDFSLTNPKLSSLKVKLFNIERLFLNIPPSYSLNNFTTPLFIKIFHHHFPKMLENLKIKSQIQTNDPHYIEYLTFEIQVNTLTETISKITNYNQNHLNIISYEQIKELSNLSQLSHINSKDSYLIPEFSKKLTTEISQNLSFLIDNFTSLDIEQKHIINNIKNNKLPKIFSEYTKATQIPLIDLEQVNKINLILEDSLLNVLEILTNIKSQKFDQHLSNLKIQRTVLKSIKNS